MQILKHVVVTTLAGMALALAGCSSASSDWAKASATNTVAAYQGFISAHPSDPHAAEAKTLIAQQEDNAAWAEAQKAPTVAGYQGYLNKYPQGSNSGAAHAMIMDMNRANDWKSAQSGGATAIRAFLDKYSTGSEVDQAKAQLKTLTAFHAKFATESSEARAQKKLTEIQKRASQQVSNLQVTPSADNKSYLVESGGMTEDEAKTLCQSVKKSLPRCEVVQE